MGNSIEVKINRRFFVNLLLIVVSVAALLETAELALIAYSIKNGLLCK